MLYWRAACHAYTLAHALLLVFLTYTSRRMLLRPRARRPADEALPPLSVVRPLCGLEDGGLEQNLESLYTSDYPHARLELVYSCESPKDPALAVARTIAARHPTLSTRFIAPERRSDNAKVNNTWTAYDACKPTNDWVLLLDANVCLERDDLWRKMERSTRVPDVAASCGAIGGFSPANLWGRVECAFLNTSIMRGMANAELLGQTVLVGKSCLLSRRHYAEVGGFEAVKRHICEDSETGYEMSRRGMRVPMDPVPARQHVGTRTFAHVWARFARWNMMRRIQAPRLFYAEPLLLPTLLAAVAAAPHLPHDPAAAAFAAAAYTLFFWFTDVLVWRAVDPSVRFGDTVVPWLVREALWWPLWFKGIVARTVYWRERAYTVLRDGTLVAAGAAEARRAAVE